MEHPELWNVGPGFPPIELNEFEAVNRSVTDCLRHYGDVETWPRDYHVVDEPNLVDRTQGIFFCMGRTVVSRDVIQALQRLLLGVTPMWRLVLGRSPLHRKTLWIYPEHVYVGDLPGGSMFAKTRLDSSLTPEDAFRLWLNWSGRPPSAEPRTPAERHALACSADFTGSDFRRLLDLAARWAKNFIAVYQMRLNVAHDPVDTLLTPYLIEVREPDTWPIQQLEPERFSRLCRYELTMATASILCEKAGGLYSLGVLEDLGFLRDDGTPWFISHTHKRCCLFDLTSEEKALAEEVLGHDLVRMT